MQRPHRRWLGPSIFRRKPIYLDWPQATECPLWHPPQPGPSKNARKPSDLDVFARQFFRKVLQKTGGPCLNPNFFVNLHSEATRIPTGQLLNDIIMEIITAPITAAHLSEIAHEFYDGMVKGVVDIDRNILAISAEFQADLERELLQNGSLQESLWGINLYPGVEGEDFIEFDSLINIAPRRNNFSRDVEDPAIRERIRNIVNTLIV